MELIWKRCVFGLCGVVEVHREMFGVVVTSSQKQREEWLLQVRDAVDAWFPPDAPELPAGAARLA